MWFETSESGADQAGDGVAGLGDLLVRGRAALGDGLADAVLEVLVEQIERHRLQRPGRGGDLGEDVDAVVVVLDHPLQPAHLTLDAPQAPQMVVLVVAVAVHLPLLSIFSAARPVVGDRGNGGGLPPLYLWGV